MKNFLSTAFGVAVVGFAMMATPSFADHSRSERIARELSGALYGGSAAVMCGRKACYKPGREVGREVFDQSQNFTDWYGEQAGNAGRKLRSKYCRKYGC